MDRSSGNISKRLNLSASEIEVRLKELPRYWFTDLLGLYIDREVRLLLELFSGSRLLLR